MVVNFKESPLKFIMLIVSLALTIVYGVLWLNVSSTDIGRSDYTSMYVGGTLLHQGYGAQIYNEDLQQKLHAQLIKPDVEGNLPFVSPPTTAVAMAPFTSLSLANAYRIWSLIQLFCFLLALLITARSAIWPREKAKRNMLQYGIIALGAPALLGLFVQAQWDGVIALGLALAYRSFTKKQFFLGSFILTFSFLFAKPHLFVGIFFFLMARANKKIFLGFLSGAASVFLISLWAVGLEGVLKFVQIIFSTPTLKDYPSTVGFAGIISFFTNNDQIILMVVLLLSIPLIAFAIYCGMRWRKYPRKIEMPLVGAAMASLLISPHLLPHDLILLSLLFIIAAAAVLRQHVIDAEGSQKKIPIIGSSKVHEIVIPMALETALLLGWVVCMVIVLSRYVSLGIISMRILMPIFLLIAISVVSTRLPLSLTYPGKIFAHLKPTGSNSND